MRVSTSLRQNENRGRRRPQRSRLPLRAAALGLLLAVTALTAHAGGPKPAIRLQLADLGFNGASPFLTGAGASMLTVHFVDSSHLLVTYSLRDLVERIPNDPPGDADRAVGAVLVELPSGKILARTRWHLHDYSQYIWSLGNGRFLIRMHSTLTAIAPMANLASGDPFHQTPFVHLPETIDAILVAPEGDLVTVEATPAPKPKPPPGPVTFLNVDDPNERPPVDFFFVRVTGTGAPGSPIQAVSAGSAKGQRVAPLPLNSRGYLSLRSEKHARWTMQFNSFDGESRKLSWIDSSCQPWMQFVSPSQFIVFSCRGSDDKIQLSAFDFKPQEMWEEPMGGATPIGQFLFAQQAGRFALGRITTPVAYDPTTRASLGIAPPMGGTADSTVTQEMWIYQVESGDLLLKLPCSPVSHTGQNFDLSPDGLRALVVRDTAIEIYPLPPLSARDKKDLAEVQQQEPKFPAATMVDLRHLVQTAEDAEQAPSPLKAAEAPQNLAATPAPATATPASVPTKAAATGTAANEGDVVETHRKPPSLLNPGETVDGAKKPPPQ